MKQIIILDIMPANGGDITARAVFWIPVPGGQERPLPNLSQSTFTGASAEEIAALQKGVVLEEVRSFPFPSTVAPDQIQQLLLSHYVARVEYLNAIPFGGKFYGMFYDGNGWNGK